jgi:hypothetical protein
MGEFVPAFGLAGIALPFCGMGTLDGGTAVLSVAWGSITETFLSRVFLAEKLSAALLMGTDPEKYVPFVM